MKRIAVIAILLLAFCGLADAAYLAQHVASNTPVLCNIHGLSDCNAVINSQYSHIFGIPLAYLGVFFYAVVLILSAVELALSDWFLRRVLQLASLVGFFASIYFVSLQAFAIHAFCEYCLTSAAITLLILFCAGFIEPMKSGENTLVPPISPSRLTMPPAA